MGQNNYEPWSRTCRKRLRSSIHQSIVYHFACAVCRNLNLLIMLVHIPIVLSQKIITVMGDLNAMVGNNAGDGVIRM